MSPLRRATGVVLVALILVVAAPWVPAAGAAEADTKTVEIRTVPPLPGVEVVLDGVTTTTDALGNATLETEEFRNAGERLVVLDERVDLPGGDGYFEYSRTFGKSLNLVLAFDLYREASFRFVTLQGRELTLEEIDSLQLKNTLGGRFEDVDRSAPVMLHANRVVSSPTGPVVRDIVWSVDSVLVGSSNVVNRSEIRFTPTTETDILVTTLFFDATFTVQDLFFGFPTGLAVLVENPSGEVISYPLIDGELTLEDLPRGDYRATVVGPGLELSRPVALSRNQDVDLALLSYLDLAVGAAGLAIFATGTFITGWRRRKRRQRQRRREVLSGRGSSLESVGAERATAEVADRPEVGTADQTDEIVSVPFEFNPAVTAEISAVQLAELGRRSRPASGWQGKLLGGAWLSTIRWWHAMAMEALGQYIVSVREKNAIGADVLHYFDHLRQAADELGARPLADEHDEHDEHHEHDEHDERHDEVASFGTDAGPRTSSGVNGAVR